MPLKGNFEQNNKNAIFFDKAKKSLEYPIFDFTFAEQFERIAKLFDNAKKSLEYPILNFNFAEQFVRIAKFFDIIYGISIMPKRL